MIRHLPKNRLPLGQFLGSTCPQSLAPGTTLAYWKISQHAKENGLNRSWKLTQLCHSDKQQEDVTMKQLQPLTPAALYARVSSDRQDVDLSVAAQLRALRDYARNNGYSIAREYVDEAESGQDRRPAPVPQHDRRGRQGHRSLSR